MIPDLDRVTSPAYLANLLTRPITDIRSMRAEGQSIENGLSYVRRVAQGRIDIVAAELQRRRDGGDPADLSDLVARLPDILADRHRSGGPVRAPHEITVDRVADELLDDLDAILGPGAISDLTHRDEADLAATRDALTDFERRLSATRRSIHDTLDTLQAELTRRYRTGEATVDSLLQ
ncbi:MAG: hypothetical protein E6G39_09565 [Actinobacteria bacterium]|nr:MAG: hypothetical protein E6G39_09565 [Actinomycetota bacterium]